MSWLVAQSQIEVSPGDELTSDVRNGKSKPQVKTSRQVSVKSAAETEFWSTRKLGQQQRSAVRVRGKLPLLFSPPTAARESNDSIRVQSVAREESAS